MDVKVDALMLKRLFMEGPSFLLASLLIIIFAFPVKADPPADHNLNVDFPFCNVDFLNTFFQKQEGKVSYGRWTIIELIVMHISIYLAYQVYVFLTF